MCKSPISTSRTTTTPKLHIKLLFSQALLLLSCLNLTSEIRMQACDFCGYDGNGDAVSFHRFPLEEESRRRWMVNMRRDAEWTPSESASLCSAHFTPDCFESGAAHLHPNAIPTRFDFTQSMSLNTENIPQDQGEHKSTDPSCCGCYKRLQATEKVYQLKLAAAQLQIKQYKNNLAEESRKAAQWQKRAIVLQSAIRAMKQRGLIPTTRKTSTPKNTNLE